MRKALFACVVYTNENYFKHRYVLFGTPSHPQNFSSATLSKMHRNESEYKYVLKHNLQSLEIDTIQCMIHQFSIANVNEKITIEHHLSPSFLGFCLGKKINPACQYG